MQKSFFDAKKVFLMRIPDKTKNRSGGKKGAKQEQHTQKKQTTQAKHEYRQQACWRSSCQASQKKCMAKAAHAAKHSDRPQQAKQAAKH